MAATVTILVASDFHYAAAAERARSGYETRAISHPFWRLWGKLYYRFIWMADTTAHYWQLDQFLEQAPPSDWLIANGDYTCDSGFVGISESAACASAHECLGKLRARGGKNFAATIGDHELGKISTFSGAGGMRLASWKTTTHDLALPPFWEIRLGKYVVMGVTSTLLALPVYEREALPDEIPEWRHLRELHVGQIREAFDRLAPAERVVIFCHDPTALPFLGQEESVARRLPQIERTIIGHLHSPAVFKTGQWLAGMPIIRFLGHVPRRLSTSLNRARAWKPFKPFLCPALSGVQLLKDGGYLTLKLDPEGQQALEIQRYRLPWN